MTWAQHKSRAGIERKIIALQRRRGAVAEPLQPAVERKADPILIAPWRAWALLLPRLGGWP